MLLLKICDLFPFKLNNKKKESNKWWTYWQKIITCLTVKLNELYQFSVINKENLKTQVLICRSFTLISCESVESSVKELRLRWRWWSSILKFWFTLPNFNEGNNGQWWDVVNTNGQSRLIWDDFSFFYYYLRLIRFALMLFRFLLLLNHNSRKNYSSPL